MKLAKREKLFIGAAGCILGIFLIMEMLVFPFFDHKDTLKKDTKALEKAIIDLDIIGVKGRNFNNTSGNMENALANRKEPLYTFIYKEAVSIGLEPELNPSEGEELDGFIEEKCAVDLKAVTWSQLTNFLSRIEKPEKYIFISSITISKNKKKEGYLEANIRVMSYKKENPEQ